MVKLNRFLEGKIFFNHYTQAPPLSILQQMLTFVSKKKSGDPSGGEEIHQKKIHIFSHSSVRLGWLKKYDHDYNFDFIVE